MLVLRRYLNHIVLEAAVFFLFLGRVLKLITVAHNLSRHLEPHIVLVADVDVAELVVVVSAPCVDYTACGKSHCVTITRADVYNTVYLLRRAEFRCDGCGCLI